MAWVCLLLLISACRTGGLQGGVFVKPGVRYAVGGTPPGFRPVKLEDNDLAFVSLSDETSLAINSTCEDYDDAPLEVLTRQLLMGFTEVQTLEQKKEPLDGRESLHTHVRAKLDGVAQELMLVVVKKNHCIFDIILLSPPARFSENHPALMTLLHNFRVEEPR